MRTGLKIGLGILALGFSALAFAETGEVKCNLGETCTLEGKLTAKVLFVVTPHGSCTHGKYLCSIKSNNKLHRIYAVIKSGDNFKFSKQYVKADTSGKEVLIDGSFPKPGIPGQIKIKNISFVTGSVSCNKAT